MPANNKVVKSPWAKQSRPRDSWEGDTRCLYSPVAEKDNSRKLVVARSATNIPFHSGQSSVTPGSCCLLPGYSHTCCEDLLRGATGCCSPVARYRSQNTKSPELRFCALLTDSTREVRIERVDGSLE